MDQDTKSEDNAVTDFKGDPVEIQDSKISVKELKQNALNGMFVEGEDSERAMAMEEEFDELVSVRHGLDRATDELNKCIEEFEQRLRDCNPGISAWVDFEVSPAGDEAEEPPRSCQLGFYRTQDGGERGWHLVTIVAEGAVLRLIRAPRSVRVAATTRFRDLVNQITKRSKEMLEDVEAATQRLQKEL
jgi:hypothetical protein